MKDEDHPIMNFKADNFEFLSKLTCRFVSSMNSSDTEPKRVDGNEQILVFLPVGITRKTRQK